MTEPTFAMLVCACGAETVVKDTIAEDGWRLSFSRPGFVTAKHDSAAELPQGVFIRSACRALGKARSGNLGELVDALRDQLETGTQQPFHQLHVWPKDRVPIGRFGFEPGQDEVSRSVADEIFRSIADPWLSADAPNRIAQPGDRVLDVVLVEPSHWFFGTHDAAGWHSRWPGGVQPIEPQHEPISRAYYKAAEAITWSGFEMSPGDLVVDIGSAPGGASGRLLELGMRVIGIDPAMMDRRITQNPRFRHIRARAGDLPRKEFRGAKWMLVDSNVKPDKTLVTVKNIVTHRVSEFQGLLITMKIGDYESAGLIEHWRESIARWNPRSIRVRQLARNKCEVCFAIAMR